MEEIYLQERYAARISCPRSMIPSPGQYLLATCSSDPHAPLALPLFQAGLWRGGFFAAPPLPAGWLPGAQLKLRGPLGKGFLLPPNARRVALLAWRSPGACLLALLEPALKQNASVALLTDQPPGQLPSALEIQPLSALPETFPWADYLAVETGREQLPTLLPLLLPNYNKGYAQPRRPQTPTGSAQILLHTAMPCGGIAACAVCAVTLPPVKNFQLACKDGPVFNLL